MKTLSIEEKAKAYDKAVERAKVFKEHLLEINDKGYADEMDYIFPELKESEDERIRKELIGFIKGQEKVSSLDTSVYQSWLAWLEKQGEQNPQGKSAVMEEKVDNANKLEPKFKVDDYVVDNCGYVWRVEGILNQFYILEGIDGGESRPTIEWVNNTFHLWDITKDVKDGDVITDGRKMIVIFKHFKDPSSYRQHIVAYIGLDNSGKIQITDDNDTWYFDIDSTKPATKEQCNLLFQKMKEAGYEWDAEKKELKKIELRQEELTEFEKSVKQMMEEAIECGDIHNLKADADMLLRLAQKPAWSEEDENMRLDLIQYFTDGYGLEHNLAYIVDWLKSLKPQKQWKPSEEQIEALVRCVDYLEESDNEDLLVMESLLEQLKSLK